MRILFYGCTKGIDESHREAGHYMYEPGPTSAFRAETPWGKYPDGTLAPEGGQHQGLALLHKKDGWTAIGFWDRTGDSRGNSNSNFFAEGDFTFDEMVELAKKHFPAIMKRIGTIRLKA